MYFILMFYLFDDLIFYMSYWFGFCLFFFLHVRHFENHGSLPSKYQSDIRHQLYSLCISSLWVYGNNHCIGNTHSIDITTALCDNITATHVFFWKHHITTIPSLHLNITTLHVPGVMEITTAIPTCISTQFWCGYIVHIGQILHGGINIMLSICCFSIGLRK